MRVLTWNLFHGRSVPDTPRSLLAEFAAALAGWRWDVALLQEVPPWWPVELGRACGAGARSVPTSRNCLLPVRRWVAERRPDLIKSNGGGANAILVRGEAIAAHRARRLRLLPERRVAHGVRLESGVCVVNLHGERDDTAARADLALARAFALDLAAGTPCVIGGDLNLTHPAVEGFTHVAASNVDHVLVRGLRAAGPAERLDRGSLSDHVPLAVDLDLTPARAARTRAAA